MFDKKEDNESQKIISPLLLLDFVTILCNNKKSNSPCSNNLKLYIPDTYISKNKLLFKL